MRGAVWAESPARGTVADVDAHWWPVLVGVAALGLVAALIDGAGRLGPRRRRGRRRPK
jgi:hypothetical protein